MRILHVTKKYPNALGGDAIVVQNLEKQQKKNGHEVFILTTNCDEIQNKKNLIKFGLKDIPEKLDNITIKRIFSLIDLYLTFPKIIKTIKPDVIHCHSIDMGYIISKICKKYNIPIIETLHTGIHDELKGDKLRDFLERFLINSSKFNKIITVNELDITKSKIKDLIFIPNGVDLEEFKFKYNKENKKIKILFVGRLEEQKGLRYLIEAISLIKDKHVNLKVLIIGEGSKKEEFEELSSSLGLNKNIFFLGAKNQKEVFKYYQSSNIFILPSLAEGFPLTILEAWAAELPVIVTNVGGISKICKDKENALIIQPKDSEAIAEAMLTLINDTKLRDKLGKAGRKLVEQKYNWKIINNQIEKIYNQFSKNHVSQK